MSHQRRTASSSKTTNAQRTTADRNLAHATGATELMRAVTSNDPLRLARLLNDPRTVDSLFATDAKGRTALDWARICRNYDAVTLIMKAINTQLSNARVQGILSSAADFDDYVKRTNDTQALQLREALKQRNALLASQILQQNSLSRLEVESLGEKYFCDWPGTMGYTPLMLAAGMNMKDVVQKLVRLAVPLEAENKVGHTALTLAASVGNADVVHFLLFSGANIHHRTQEGRTALHYACMYAKAKIVKVMLDFMLERFAVFRVQGHALIDFDYTRWTTYAGIFEGLINARDKDFKTCEDLLPAALPDKLDIERRLLRSRVAHIDPLQSEDDPRSVATNYSYVDEIEFFNDNQRVTQQVIAEEKTNNADILSQCDPDLLPPDAQSVVSELSAGSREISIAQFSHDTDDMFVGENVQDESSLKTSMPLEHEVSCIRHAFDHVRERISLWMSNAAKEEALAQLVPCPLDCGEQCKVEDMTTHVRDHCQRRTLQCSACHQMVISKDLDIHSKRHCPKRIVACPKALQGCGALLTADSAEVHCRMHCCVRLMHCRQYCSALVMKKDLEKHEKEHCRNRLIHCDQCDEEMVAHSYPSHLQTLCPQRRVLCKVGCGEMFAAKDIADHEENVCKRVCRWPGCGAKIGPPAKLALHEQIECLSRPETCCFACNVPRLTRRTKSLHERTQCRERWIHCDLGCGQRIRAREKDLHQDAFLGSCPERMTRCPSNLVGWRVLIVATQTPGIVLKYERKLRGQPLTSKFASFPSSSSRTQKNESSSNKEEVEQEESFTDEIFVKQANGHLWFNVWATEMVLLEKLPSASTNKDKENFDKVNAQKHRDEDFCCGWMPFSSLDKHLADDCPHRKVIVESHADRRVGAHGQKISLQGAVALAERKAASDAFNDLSRAEENQLEDSCPFCGKDILRTSMSHHIENDCQENMFLCPLACGERIRRKDIEKHAQSLCRKRNVVCPLCRSDELWAEELSNHMQFLCSHRIIPCKLDCGIDNLLACDEEKHLQQQCPLRTVQCSCGLLFRAKELPAHKELDCNDRIVSCFQGCGLDMPFYQMNDHMEVSCPRRFHILQKLKECPNGCGREMMQKELLEHCTYHCEKRLVECPQSCGNVVQLDILKKHLVTCPQRVICCEPGMKVCSRTMFQWFYKPVDDERKKETERDLNESSDQSISMRSKAKSLSQLESSILSGAENVIPEAASKFAKNLMLSQGDEDTLLSEESSIYMDGSAMKFREQLRMSVCEQHRMTVFMAAVKYDDVELAEMLIKQVRECEDIDLENVFGDTALTLACRLGKLSFVQLFLHHGADVNKETSNGRTALIEAIKSETENIAIIELLIHSGALVLYRNRRHGRSALEWARRYGASEAAAIAARNEEIRRTRRETALRDVDLFAGTEYAAETEAETNLDGQSETTISGSANRDENKSSQSSRFGGKNEKLIGGNSSHSAGNAPNSENNSMGENTNNSNKSKSRTETERDGDEIIELTEERKRLLGRPHTVRVLELAAAVQQQLNQLFNKIAAGDTAWLQRVLGDGDFFDPNNELKAYKEMDVFASHATETDTAITRIQSKMGGMSKTVDAALIQHKLCVEEIERKEEALQELYKEERQLDQETNAEFARFESLATRLQAVDLEEIVRCKAPSPLLLVCVFACAVVFDLLPQTPEEILSGAVGEKSKSDSTNSSNNTTSSSNATNTDSLTTATTATNVSISSSHSSSRTAVAEISHALVPAKRDSLSDSLHCWTRDSVLGSRARWWSAVARHLQRPQTLLRRMQTFSRGRLHAQLSAPLLRRARLALEIALRINEAETDTVREMEELDEEDSLSESSFSVKDSLTRTHSQRRKRKQRESDNRDKNRRRSSSVDANLSQFLSQKTVKTSDMTTSLTAPTQVTLQALQTIDMPDGTSIVVEDALAAEREKEKEKEKERMRRAAKESAHGRDADRDKTIGEEIPDAEWDSDADDAMSGEWVKGEWVAHARKRENWWNRDGEKDGDRSEGDGETRREQRRRDRRREERTVFLTDDLIQRETQRTRSLFTNDNDTDNTENVVDVSFANTFAADVNKNANNNNNDSGRNTRNTTSSNRNNERADKRGELQSPPRSRSRSPSRSPSRSSSRTGKRRSSSVYTGKREKETRQQRREKEKLNSIVDVFLAENPDIRSLSPSLSVNPLLRCDSEAEVGYRFMESVFSLLSTLCRFSSQSQRLVALKEKAMRALKELEDLRTKNARLQAIYTEQYEVRANNEKEYIRLLKKARFLQEKMESFKNKVRVARLMNHVCVNGHTAISWAASYGYYDAVELMLSRGGTVGYTAPTLHLVATFLQRSYRIYRMLLQARYEPRKDILRGSRYSVNEKARQDVEIITYIRKPTLAKSENMNLIRKLTELRMERKKILLQIQHARAVSRFPVPEATYAGKWEVLQRIYERNLMHSYFCDTWMYPSAPPPLRRVCLSHQYEHTRIDWRTVAVLGVNDLAAGNFVAGSGWLPILDAQDPHAETQQKVEEILASLGERVQKFRANRDRIRILQREAMNQRLGEQEMAKAIYQRDFRHILRLAEDRGITIDLETPDGQTALTAAAEEDCAAMNHELMRNDDGSECLAVEFLLDRKYYRPSLNLETTTGWTALIRASMLGRAEVVVALLDRGATLSYQNKEGRTALHYAALFGQSSAMRILLERQAELDLRDAEGLTAYDLAERENYVKLMTLLSQFRSGNIGGLQLTRGRVNNLAFCPLGCGDKLLPHEREKHLREECSLRVVECPNNCGAEGILSRELEEHLSSQCALRVLLCPDCHEEGMLAGDLPAHQETSCVMRKLPCFLDCGKIYPFQEMEKHMKLLCMHRWVPCPLRCLDTLPNDEDNTKEGRDIPLCVVIENRGRAKKKKDKNESQRQAMIAKMNAERVDDDLPEGVAGIRFVRHSDLTQHTQNECANRRVTCPNRCHNLIVFHELDLHLRELCPDRLVDCEFCLEQVKMKDMEPHQSTHCPRRPVRCREKCGELVPFDEMERHLREDCQHRTLPCVLGCGMSVQRKYLERHLEQECRLRLVVCPNHCLEEEKENANESDDERSVATEKDDVSSVISRSVRSLSLSSQHTLTPRRKSEEGRRHRWLRVPAFRLEQHVKFECDRRPVRCQQCHGAQTVPLCELPRHQNEECSHRMVPCRNEGCMKQLSCHERDFHEHNLCRFRLISCPQACGEKVVALHMGVHTNRHCPQRVVDCSRGCGMKVKWPEMDEHLAHECARRPIESEAERLRRLLSSSAPELRETAMRENKPSASERLRESRAAEQEAVKTLRNKLAQSGEMKTKLSEVFAKDNTRQTRRVTMSSSTKSLPPQPSPQS